VPLFRRRTVDVLETPSTAPVRPLDRIDRPRLQNRLTGPLAAPITVLAGAPGCGKSELLRPLRADSDVIFFRAGREHATFGRFVQGLARAVAGLVPGAAASFPRAWERALQSPAPAIVLAHWLCEHLQAFDRHIVIDDLHASAADPGIAAFIGKLAELRPNAALTMAVRSVGALPIALWMATRRMESPIDEAELRFDRSETRELARQLGLRLTNEEAGGVLAAVGGLPIAVAYVLTRLGHDPHEFSRDVAPETFAEIAGCVYARRSERERAFLHNARCSRASIPIYCNGADGTMRPRSSRPCTPTRRSCGKSIRPAGSASTIAFGRISKGTSKPAMPNTARPSRTERCTRSPPPAVTPMRSKPPRSRG
jgi:hypothetical protein